MNCIRRILAAAVVTGATAAALHPTVVLAGPETDVGFRGWGPRVGLSGNEDQVHFGAHIDFGSFGQHVRFQPNLEMGFGDNMKLFAANAEASYRFSSEWDVWSPYLGGGVGANFRSADSGGHSRSKSDLGVNLLGGIEKGLSNGDRFFIEGKLGVSDGPDFKGTVGWTFYH